MRIELKPRQAVAKPARLYHSMYQMFSFTMLLALLTNNVGILWVAMEAATLNHRAAGKPVPHAGEPGGGVEVLHPVRRWGLRRPLFGTILLYFAAEKVLGPGGTALLWTHLNAVKGDLEPTVLGLAFVFLLVGYGTKVGLVPLHNWLPDAHAEGRHRSPQCCRGCCSTSRCMQWCVPRSWSKARSAAISPAT